MDDEVENIPFTKQFSLRNQKKKNRNKLYQNARGFAKQGVFGRGEELSESQASYFSKILDVLKQPFSSCEEKADLANNVLRSCEGSEIKCSSNQLASRSIEYLIGFASEELFVKFTNEFANNFRPICSDQFASHILQKLVAISFLRAVGNLQDLKEPSKKKSKDETVLTEREYNLDTDFSLDHRKHCSKFVQKTAKFLLNNLEDFVSDNAANYIIRSTIENLAGIKQVENNFAVIKKNRNVSTDVPPLNVPKEWIEILMDYSDRLPKWPQFADFPYETYTSGILQSLCIALNIHDKNELESLGEKIIEKSLTIQNDDSNDKISVLFSTESSIRFLELLITLAENKLYAQILTSLFIGNLKKLSEMRSGNFVVQKLIDHCKCETQFNDIFDELSPHLQLILQIGHSGVILSLAKACDRLGVKQHLFITTLENTLECNGEKKRLDVFTLMLIQLKPYPIYIKDETCTFYINIHGSIILQTLLKFKRPQKIVTNLLSLSSKTLVEIFCKSQGSYIADAFMESKTIGKKNKIQFMEHLSGYYVDLAINKFGSRVLESIYNEINDEGKNEILKELSKRDRLLESTSVGVIISKKYFIRLYKTNFNEWKQKMAGQNRGGLV